MSSLQIHSTWVLIDLSYLHTEIGGNKDDCWKIIEPSPNTSCQQLTMCVKFPAKLGSATAYL